MKRIITDWKRQEQETESVEIELPYYWKDVETPDDLQGSGVCYGRMNEDSSRDEIAVIDGQEAELEFKIRRKRPLAANGFWDGFLLQRGCISSKTEFERALAKIKIAVKGVEERK